MKYAKRGKGAFPISHTYTHTHGNKRKLSRREIVIVYLCMRRHGSRYSARFPRGKEKIARELSIKDMIIGCCWVRRFSKAHPRCCRVLTHTTIWLSLSRSISTSLFCPRDEKSGFFDFSGYASARSLPFIFLLTCVFLFSNSIQSRRRFIYFGDQMAVPNNIRFEEDEERLEETVARIRDL